VIDSMLGMAMCWVLQTEEPCEVSRRWCWSIRLSEIEKDWRTETRSGPWWRRLWGVNDDGPADPIRSDGRSRRTGRHASGLPPQHDHAGGGPAIPLCC
jgi:hypothetical protein